MGHLLISHFLCSVQRRSWGLLVIVALAITGLNAQQNAQPVNVVPLTVTGVAVENGQLLGNFQAGSTAFSLPLALTAVPNATDPTCAMLDVSVPPIHLSFTGLQVDTSGINATIESAASAGNLLGNLFCSVANVLNTGASLGEVLGGLTATELNTLENGLTSLLNQAVFIPLTSSSAVVGATCSTLDFSLGPATANVLGVSTQVDDGASGPVTLTVTSTQDGKLSRLLCAFAAMSTNANPHSSGPNALLQRIAVAIGDLIG